MTEIWLRNNVRALWLGMILPAVLLMAGLLLASGLAGKVESWWLRGLGAALALVGFVMFLMLAREMRRPRLVYRDGLVLARLRPGAPLEVPLEIVEGFLLGQGPSFLPGKRYEHTEAATVVIKLASSAEEWSHVDVDSRFGKWCDSYITIRGTWCEPLSVEVVNRLNRQLADANKQFHSTPDPRS